MLRLLPLSMRTLENRGVADDGVTNEWVQTQIRDVLGVVITAEGDCILRPVEVGWRSPCDGEDLSALSLVLPSGHVRRRSAENEEHVLHLRVAIAALPFLVLFLLGLVLAAEAIEVLVEHVTLFEGVIDPVLVIGARLLEHVVE